MNSSKYYYITTPLYYVNAKPHIGTAYTSIAVDTLAKFMKLDGKQVKFLTGTDEHGQKIEQSAKQKSLHPQQYVDLAIKDFEKMNEIFNLSNDTFMRTTDPNHQKTVQQIWQTLQKNNQIYQSTYEGWYSVKDEAFYQDSELIDGKAPTGAEVTWLKEPCYFFKLSQWQDKLLEFYAENPNFISPKYRKNQVVNFVKSGLKDLCISRSSFKWGIPVPNDSKNIIYVWFDALINYISYLQSPDISENFDNFWNNSLHIVGKDILIFHTVYWPAILMAAKITPPKQVFAHGWWTNDGKKISKSTGNVIDPIELANQYGTDQIRYFLLSEITFGRDADFSYTNLKNRINANLSNDLGNLVQRVLSFIYKNNDGKIIPQIMHEQEDEHILNIAQQMVQKVRKAAHDIELHKMCSEIWHVVSLANKYVDKQQPWVLKKENNNPRLQTVLYILTEVIRHIAIVAQAIIPKGASVILDQLSIPKSNRSITSLDKFIESDIIIDKPFGIFPRAEDK